MKRKLYALMLTAALAVTAISVPALADTTENTAVEQSDQLTGEEQEEAFADGFVGVAADKVITGTVADAIADSVKVDVEGDVTVTPYDATEIVSYTTSLAKAVFNAIEDTEDITSSVAISAKELAAAKLATVFDFRVDTDEEVKVTFDVESVLGSGVVKVGDAVYVLHQSGSEWEVVGRAVMDKSFTVDATFTSFSPVAFSVVDATDVELSDGADKGEEEEEEEPEVEEPEVEEPEVVIPSLVSAENVSYRTLWDNYGDLYYTIMAELVESTIMSDLGLHEEMTRITQFDLYYADGEEMPDSVEVIFNLTSYKSWVSEGDYIYIVHRKSDGTWEVAGEGILGADLEVSATFTEFSPVAIYKVDSDDFEDEDEVKSYKTGY